MLGAGACGPVEPQLPEERPPYIGTVDPSEAIYQVRGDDTEVTLRAVELYDPNREDDLHAVWIGSNQGFISETTTDRIADSSVRRRGAEFFQFEEITQSVDPCIDGETRGRETIWLYVSDRSFQSITPEAVEGAEGAFVVSHSWVLDYVCQQ